MRHLTKIAAITCLLAIHGMATAADLQFKAPDHKEFRANDFCINGYTCVRNIKVVVVQGISPEVTAWSVDFDVVNRYWSEREDPSFTVSFYTSTGGRLPIPNGERVFIHNWQDHCYYREASHMQRDGVISIPYAEFVNLADHIGVTNSGVSGPQGKC